MRPAHDPDCIFFGLAAPSADYSCCIHSGHRRVAPGCICCTLAGLPGVAFSRNRSARPDDHDCRGCIPLDRPGVGHVSNDRLSQSVRCGDCSHSSYRQDVRDCTCCIPAGLGVVGRGNNHFRVNSLSRTTVAAVLAGGVSEVFLAVATVTVSSSRS